MKTKFGKTIAGVALLFCAYGAGGCHGDLDIMQDNKLSASNMWKEESDATSATYGLYVYLRSALKSMNDIYLCWGELRNGLWGPGTHNTLNGVDQSQVRTSTMSSVNEYADWTALYTTVNQANLVIRHVPAMGLKEKPRAFCLGNAHFIRAYCFFQIARIWGDAPLPLWGYESTDTELFLGRTPVSEVLMRVERDIADAERYVADTSDKTVATPAAVAMLKADYALWMYRMQAGGEAYLAMAQEALGELGLSDALLEPAYADIFSSSNKCGREVIFAVHQDVSEALNGPAYYLGWNESYVEAAYRNNPVPTTGGNRFLHNLSFRYWDRDKNYLSVRIRCFNGAMAGGPTLNSPRSSATRRCVARGSAASSPHIPTSIPARCAASSTMPMLRCTAGSNASQR